MSAYPDNPEFFGLQREIGRVTRSGETDYIRHIEVVLNINFYMKYYKKNISSGDLQNDMRENANNYNVLTDYYSVESGSAPSVAEMLELIEKRELLLQIFKQNKDYIDYQTHILLQMFKPKHEYDNEQNLPLENKRFTEIINALDKMGLLNGLCTQTEYNSLDTIQKCIKKNKKAILKKFRKLAIQYHPDKQISANANSQGSYSTATAVFQGISAAHDILKEIYNSQSGGKLKKPVKSRKTNIVKK